MRPSALPAVVVPVHEPDDRLIVRQNVAQPILTDLELEHRMMRSDNQRPLPVREEIRQPSLLIRREFAVHGTLLLHRHRIVPGEGIEHQHTDRRKFDEMDDPSRHK